MIQCNPEETMYPPGYGVIALGNMYPLGDSV